VSTKILVYDTSGKTLAKGLGDETQALRTIDGELVWEEDIENLSKELTGKDSNGIFTTVEWKDGSDNLRKRSVLSGTSPEYGTRTVTWYAPDGTTVIRTQVYSLSYDLDGDFIGEELQ
jgi:hypothetical protein